MCLCVFSLVSIECGPCGWPPGHTGVILTKRVQTSAATGWDQNTTLAFAAHQQSLFSNTPTLPTGAPTRAQKNTPKPNFTKIINK